MMEFPIDTGAGDIVRRNSYIHSLDVADGRASDISSTKSSAKRDENGAVILQFPRGGNQVLKLGADVDELEQERLMALMDERYMTWKHRWFSILEGRPHEFDETLSLVFNITSFSVVIISIIVFLVASFPEISGAKSEIDVKDPLFWIEAVCIAYFIFEAILRVYCVPLNLLFNALFVIDLVTIAGFFTDFFAGAAVSFLRVLRLLRVFRVMKISRYSKTLQLVFKVFAQSASGLSVLLMPIFLVVITSATILYFIEIADATWNPVQRRWFTDTTGRPAAFQSIFDGIWFTMATITTIGYGDYVPQSLAGKLIASLLALFGVLTLSFPNLVLGANLESAFALHKKSAARESLSKRFRKVWLMIAFIRRSRVLADTRKIKEEQFQAVQAAAQKTATSKKKKGRGRASGSSQADDEDDEDDSHFANFGYSTIPPHKRIFPDMEEEPSDRAIGGTSVDRDRALFFELTVNQCASLVQGVHDTITDDNVRMWTFKGITVRKMLQALFESWSGVATLLELFAVYPQEDKEQNKLEPQDMAVACLFLGAAGILDLFAFRRSSIEFCMALKHKAVMELSLHPESGRHECRRSAEFARFIWKQTTGQITYFTHKSLAKTYATWAAREKYAGIGTTVDTSPDLKLHVGVTPAEIQECRRILNQRTTDLQTVIPDIDRFEGEAMERLALFNPALYNQNNNQNNNTNSNGASPPNNHTSTLPSGAGMNGSWRAGNASTATAGAGGGGAGGGSSDDAANGGVRQSGRDEIKLTMKLMLQYQKNLMRDRLQMPEEECS